MYIVYIVDLPLLSRHIVVCCVAKKAGREYIDRKIENSFSRMHSFMAPSVKHTIFVSHIANLIKFTTAICELWVFKISI